MSNPKTVPSSQSILVAGLRAFLGLEAQRVVVFNQNWKIPSDSGLYITVSSLGPAKPYGSTQTLTVTKDGALVEALGVPMREILGIDLASRSQEAIDRVPDVLAFFGSTECEQLCEKYSIKLAKIPMGFSDASGLEGAATINRQHTAVALLRTRLIERAVPYFNAEPKPELVLEP